MCRFADVLYQALRVVNSTIITNKHYAFISYTLRVFMHICLCIRVHLYVHIHSGFPSGEGQGGGGGGDRFRMR